MDQRHAVGISRAWLCRQARPLHDPVAITGQSRGGEAVLLVAATFVDAVAAVMAYMSASCVHIPRRADDPARGRFASTWTLAGRPLAHLWQDNRTGTYAPCDHGPEPRRHEYAAPTAMTNRARIPVKAITAPVLLAHGIDGRWWPTDYHCDVIEAEMRAAGRHVERLRCVGAGHVIAFPRWMSPSRRGALNLILGLQVRHGLSFLFVSDGMAVVERVAHRLATMYLGEIVETDPRAAIVENPWHPHITRRMAVAPILDPARHLTRLRTRRCVGLGPGVRNAGVGFYGEQNRPLSGRRAFAAGPPG